MVSIPPGSSLGRYRVIEQLGRGGMATVFRAHDPNLDRFVAVKVLPSYYTEDPTFIDRFIQEAQTIAKLRHANILQIFDFGEDKGFTYIVSELVSGGTLQDKLGHEPLPIEQVIALMRPLADALDYAHSQGIIHRDIKPANVLIDESDNPILADFGLARMLEASIRYTQTSQALGTPEYMSPEQAMGADADHRSDLYAFGVLLYQMLVGQTPFRADTPAATLMAHVHKPLPLPTLLNSKIEPRIEAILLKALAKNPDDRFQSAKDIMTSIAWTGTGTPSASQGDSAATAVMDIADGAATQVLESPTEAMNAGAPMPNAPMDPAPAGPPDLGGTQDAATSPSMPVAQPSPDVQRKETPKWLWFAIGSGVMVIIALIVVLVFVSGGDPDDSDAAVAVAPAVPSVQAAPRSAGLPVPTAAPTPPPVATTVPTPGPTPLPTPDIGAVASALSDMIAEAQPWIHNLRDLEVDGDISVEFRSRSDLDEITRGFFRRPNVRQQVYEAQELYKALGLMQEEDDLEEILTKIQNQQVLALFDDQTEKVYMLLDDSATGPEGELGYANAYMGALQQKRFNTADIRNRTRAKGADSFRAANALILGDVAQISSAYVARAMTKDEAGILREPVPDSELLNAPRVVRETTLFPVREGANFVAGLFGENGWETVNDAYKNPPITTEQVLHPEKYFEAEEPQLTSLPDLSSDLGKGWNEVNSDVMGEFLIRVYLEEYLDDDQAADAAAGWGGDRYSLLNGPLGERLFISMIRWDTFQDAAEFFDAYQVFMGVKYQGVEGLSTDGNQDSRRWIVPDETGFVG
ncbi:MAG: serine/threonine protein kinase, partial [Chloroflexi bacterium]|nr:serine/threonine protein kinase [Chloroflexota bacterium]